MTKNNRATVTNANDSLRRISFLICTLIGLLACTNVYADSGKEKRRSESKNNSGKVPEKTKQSDNNSDEAIQGKNKKVESSKGSEGTQGKNERGESGMYGQDRGGP